jgi:hypothetical protein
MIYNDANRTTMRKKTTVKARRNLPWATKRNLSTLAAATVVAVTGIVLIVSSRAATSIAAVEAESGSLSGAASIQTQQTGASNNSTVKFGGGSSGGNCTATAGMELKDQDFSDSQLPWERKGQPKVIINFETKNVTPEYLAHMQKGVEAWNRSACLDTRLVASCVANTNCVTTSLTKGDEADGNFDAIEKNGFTIGGHIDLYYEELDKLGPGAKLNVTIHEMGHAVGLRHRKTERVLMNGDTYTDVFDPDETDFHNLLVLYGKQ